MNTVLMVCTGNICRSPMAEALLQKYWLAEKRSLELAVASAGIYATDGNPATPEVQQVLWEEEGIDVSRHRARQINAEMIRDTDLFLVMTREHAWYLQKMEPDAAARIRLLKEFAGITGGSLDVPDPYGGGIKIYRRSLQEIREAIMQSITELESLFVS